MNTRLGENRSAVRMDNPEKLATLGTQDTEQRQTKHQNKTHNIKKISHTGTTEENWVESSELYMIFYLCVCHNFVVLMANKF